MWVNVNVLYKTTCVSRDRCCIHAETNGKSSVGNGRVVVPTLSCHGLHSKSCQLWWKGSALCWQLAMPHLGWATLGPSWWTCNILTGILWYSMLTFTVCLAFYVGLDMTQAFYGNLWSLVFGYRDLWESMCSMCSMGYYGIYGQSMATLYSMALKTGFADVGSKLTHLLTFLHHSK